jgi:hypothetical protein
LSAKDSVVFRVGHFRPEIQLMIRVAVWTAPLLYDDTVHITSANDGKHMDGSKHFDDDGIDYRCWNIVAPNEDPRTAHHKPWPERYEAKVTAEQWAADMQEWLGARYQIRFEEKWITIKEMVDGKVVETEVLVPHIHGEFDPPEETA